MEFLSLSISFWIFHLICLYYLVKHKYDLNSLYRGPILLIQEICFLAIRTQFALMVNYSNPSTLLTIGSCIYLFSTYGFYINNYFVLYRIILINKIEFGKFPSSILPKLLLRLKHYWSLKWVWILTPLSSMPAILLFLYLINSEDRKIFTPGNGYHNEYLAIVKIMSIVVDIIEFILFAFLISIGIKDQLRLTIRIETRLGFGIYILSQASLITAKSTQTYSFLVIIQNFCFAMLLMISIKTRSHLQRIPDPPIYCMTSEYIYEHKQLYFFIHDFLESVFAEDLLNSLELGMFIQIYRLEKKEYALKWINNLCIKCKLPLFNTDNEEFIYEYVTSNNEISFQYFCTTNFYQKLKWKLEINKKYMIL